MNSNIMRLIGLLIVPLFLSSCTASSNGNLQEVVNQHSQAIQQLQAQVSGVQPAQADNWSQVQSLRQEMATLKGDLDNLNNSTAHLGGVPQLGAILSRHDRALRLVETQLALNLQLNAPSTGLGATGRNTPNYTAPLNNLNNLNMAVPISTPSSSPAKPNTTDTAQALYDLGINNFNSRSYANALNSFSDFTQVYPNHKLVSNAWFWQGESNYQMKNYAAAALAYEKVITSFPNSIKAPAAYLKQGMSFLALKRNDVAKERLDHLVATYPKAPEAKRARQVLKNL